MADLANDTAHNVARDVSLDLAGRLYPLTLDGALFSYRAARENVTLDGSGNVELIINELNNVAGDDLTQGTVADRPAWHASGTAPRPAVRGDGVSQWLVGTPGWVADLAPGEVYTMYLVASNPQSGVGQSPATAGHRSAVASRYMGSQVSSARAVQHRRSGTTVDGSTLTTSARYWLRMVNDGVNMTVADSAGGSGSASTPAVNVDSASLCAWDNAGSGSQFTTAYVYWWFGYSRVLSAAEMTDVQAFLESWIGGTVP